MTHWGPTYYELTHKPTAEELEEQAASKRRHEAFPNVGYEEDKDSIVFEYALRRKSDGKIVTKLDGNGPYNFGPMGHCPEGYEVVSRSLWPMPWESTL
jgi:hypothetical protein